MEDITGHVTFIVIPTVSHEKSVENESFNVRTLYDYNPDADEYIPCKELGLFFKKGEILKIHRYVTWKSRGRFKDRIFRLYLTRWIDWALNEIL